MKKPSKLLTGCLVSLLGVGLLLLAANFFFLDFVVDVVWHNSLGYVNLLLLKIGYRYLVLGATTLIFFLIVFLNFWGASRYLGVNLRNQGGKPGGRSTRIIRAFRTGSLKVYTPISLVLAVLLAMPLYCEWESVLLWFFSRATGTRDALFHLDVSFYLFAFPLLQVILGRLLLTLLLLLVALAILYAAEMKALSLEGQPLYRGAKVHLSLIVFLIFLVMTGGYAMEALRLQYSSANTPRFFGPGHLQVIWVLPAIAVSAFALLMMAGSTIAFIHSRRGLKTFVVFGFLLFMSHLARNWKLLTDSVTNFRVLPNELLRQEPHIRSSIQATLEAYNLNKVERRDYALLRQTPPGAEPNELRNDLDNIPLWDSELLADVFRETQNLRPYYLISDVDVSRYRVTNELHQVYLAAREIYPQGLDADVNTSFVNRRLIYTHGYGAVMIPAAQRGEEPMRWYMRDMPIVSDVGLQVAQPGIYYGTRDPGYVLAPNSKREMHHPGNDTTDLLHDYQGTGGVLVGTSFWRKLVFAVYFKDRNIFWTSYTTPASRIHFRRNIQDRIGRLTPFLELDKDPYLVVTPERFYWIQDAYTRSRWYPNAASYDGVNNYIRNSVKIVVDAYDGSVAYYLAESDDPIARAYQRMYPGLIRPLDEMPKDLLGQIRYPRDLFDIQMGIYSRYHQTDPETFFQGEDQMQFAEIVHRDTLIRMQPNYLTLDLIQSGTPEFLLLTPMLSSKMSRLRALAVVGCDGENYGRIILYTFPKGSQVFGPPQINALIDQNTEIAQSITLWNQQGSEVKRGKMIVLPLDRFILYIQPLYMEATGSPRIPQLKRIILCAEETVVMDTSLEAAFEKLKATLAAQRLTTLEANE
jgi:uncharacterized membrane protein (UPF0182 family)